MTNIPAACGLPMMVTEYNTFGSGRPEARDEREAMEAKSLEMYDDFFQLSTDCRLPFLSFWDSQHWTDNAPFSARTGRKSRPWMFTDSRYTSGGGRAPGGGTDGEGTCRCRAFRGDYPVTASQGEESWTVDTPVAPVGRTLTFSLLKQESD